MYSIVEVSLYSQDLAEVGPSTGASGTPSTSGSLEPPDPLRRQETWEITSTV